MAQKSPIAIVAMSGVFPGATGIAAFWNNIVSKVDATDEVPPHRWPDPQDWVYGHAPAADKAYSNRACLIHEDQFNALDPVDIPAPSDRMYRWLLHAAGDALNQCRMQAVDKRRVGAILAAIALPTATAADLALKAFRAELSQMLGPDGSIRQPAQPSPLDRVVSRPAALVCNAFGLGGPAYTLDAACASSLYALKLACDELMAHRTDAMITGGVSGADCLYTQIGFSQLRALSPSGRCAPFDRSADGLVVGEGAGILVLKRVEDALRDEDTIYGVIRGIGLSNDMRGNLLAPDVEGQLRAMRAAYDQAGWRPWDVQYVECHGAGTPVGDAAELKSLRALWEGAPDNYHHCGIGSIKSMIGHLLTAAGAAGMIKTLLGLHHRTLPPSLKFDQPASQSPLIDAPFAVQTDPAPWPQTDSDALPRAAVSAFGFGGINGHVLIEGWPAPDRAAPQVKPVPDITVPPRTAVSEPSNAPCDIAIVGMEACFGPLPSLNAFQQAVFSGESAIHPVPPLRWKTPQAMRQVFGTSDMQGAFMQEVAVKIGEFQIPPGELPDILPQQLLMLKVAAGAMRDAGLALREPRERMGAIIGIGFDFEATQFHLRWILPQLSREWRRQAEWPAEDPRITRWLQDARDACGPPLTATRTLGALGGIVASRIAREFRFGGPSFVVSAEEASGLRAVEIAMRMLQARQADAMLVGAVDLTCDERNLVTLFDRSDISRSGRVRPFDRDADGALPGEGAVALVAKRLEDAQRDGDRVYAVIKGIGSAHSGGMEDSRSAICAYGDALARAMTDADVSPQAIGLLETHGSGIPGEDDLEASAFQSAFSDAALPKCGGVAVSALKPLIGHTGAASGLASLVKSAVCIYHHLLPVMPHFEQPRSSIHPKGVFHFPRQTTYWAADRENEDRIAVVGAMTRDGGCMHAILAQAPTPNPAAAASVERHRRPMGPLPCALFIVKGADTDELTAQLSRLEQLAENASDRRDGRSAAVEILGRQWHRQMNSAAGKPPALSIVAHSTEDLQRHLSEARLAVQNGTTHLMSARGGICYLPHAKVNEGRLAFVFPGSGNHYVGMGRTLAAHWPEVLRSMDRKTARLRSQMLPHLYDPWRADWRQGWQAEAYEALVADPLHTIFGQVVFGGHMAGLLQSFNLRPDAVIGYSLGESAGLFALGAWPDHGRMLERLAASDLFKTELCGACRSLRQSWQVPDDQEIRWRVAVVNRPVDQVDNALARSRYVRRLIINTPNECVIGGLEDQVRQVIESLGCDAFFLDGVVTVHCDAARPVAQAYKELHRFPTTAVDQVRFYSCARGEAYEVTEEAAADSILQQALNGFDFPRTIRQAYADGVRLFVEIGPQGSCTRMIRQILDDRTDMLAVTANLRGEDECLTLLKCLGSLAAAGRDIDLAPLYAPGDDSVSSAVQSEEKTIRVPIGGGPLRLPPLPAPPLKRPVRTEASDAPQAAIFEPDRQTPLKEQAISPPDPGGKAAAHHPLFGNMLEALNANTAATARVHEQFLSFSEEMTRQYGQAFQLQNQLAGMLAGLQDNSTPDVEIPVSEKPATPPVSPPVIFTREQCMEFAIGSVGKVLGPQFDIIDTYECRVRLPDEPLMLVDRILNIEGEMGSMGSGRLITEHDVLPDAWYLDGGCAPVCIAVEAGQADLFLSSYLGIDHHVKGERTYRLLDARIHFHRGLPRAGETIRYDIHIDKFVRQGATYLFFFRFEGTVEGRPLITMTDGCAGFFTEEEVRNSGGIILTDEDRAAGAVIGGAPFTPLVSVEEEGSLDDARIDALRTGDAAACFGPAFEGVHLPGALRLPDGRMRLIDRIVSLALEGGRWGLGYIEAEADIHPDDWFLTCHFVDDMVMPGTLMYECCAHTLRVLLLRLGWVVDEDGVCYEPVPGIPCRLKCRGPVTPRTQRVRYAVEIKEIGYRPEPYVLADAHMYADGRYIVFFKDMSMQMSGITRESIEHFWDTGISKPPLFTKEHILEFAWGRPSKAFGEPYAPFDDERRIARLPAPPYCFIDRIAAIQPKPWVLEADGWVEARYDMPSDGWYFAADRSGAMPFCVLLEIALQPCGWLAAFAGSALKSQKDLRFRNLGGRAILHENLFPSDRTLTMRTRMTKVSEAADMLIENFEFEVLCQGRMIYSGSTYFGFFTDQALAQQVGLREAGPPSMGAQPAGDPQPLAADPPHEPDDAPRGASFQANGLQMPAGALRMIDAVEVFNAKGGPHRLGYVRGRKQVNSDEWFFKAHFYQDPVCPGSLGIESFLQLLKYAALRRWPHLADTHRFEILCDQAHEWQYRGQVLPSNHTVIVEAVVTRIEEGAEPVILADGWLQVDGLYIYKMSGFGLKLVAL